MTRKELVETIIQTKNMKNPYDAREIMKSLIHIAETNEWYDIIAYGYAKLSEVCWKCGVISNFDRDKKIFFEQSDMCRTFAQLYGMMVRNKTVDEMYMLFFTYYEIVMQRFGEVFLIEYYLIAMDSIGTKIIGTLSSEKEIFSDEERQFYVEGVKGCMMDVVRLLEGFVDQTDVEEKFYQELKQKWLINFQTKNTSNEK